jgi:hypothetical protein
MWAAGKNNKTALKEMKEKNLVEKTVKKKE